MDDLVASADQEGVFAHVLGGDLREGVPVVAVELDCYEFDGEEDVKDEEPVVELGGEAEDRPAPADPRAA
jgi:hypothetical protein